MNTELTYVHCNKCKEYKNLIPPYFIIKKKGKYGDIVSIKGLCPDCNTNQTKKIAMASIKMESRDTFKSYPYGEYKLDTMGNITNKEGGLFPLIGLIIAGVAAAATTAGVTANIIQSKQKNEQEAISQKLALEEMKRKNENELTEMQKKNEGLIKILKDKQTSDDTIINTITDGEGVYDQEKLKMKIQNDLLQNYNKEGESLNTSLKHEIKEIIIQLKDTVLRDIIKEVLKDEVENSIELIPKLIKRPEMIKFIKNNVRGTGLNEDLNEQEQIQEAIEFLEGKGYNFL